jgi:hypothetical protein
MPLRAGGISATVAHGRTMPALALQPKDYTNMTKHTDRPAWRRRARALAGGMALLFLHAMPARAADTVPSATMQEILIKTSILTLNDAIVTGNFTVVHAKAAKVLREELGPDRIKQAFESFAEQKIDMSAISAATPVATAPAQIDDRGALLLRGRFDVGRSRLAYELHFLPSEGEWKPIKLHVSVNPLNETSTGGNVRVPDRTTVPGRAPAASREPAQVPGPQVPERHAGLSR